MDSYEDIVSRVFPIKIYHNSEYGFKLSVNEKVYFGIYQNTNKNILITDYIMSHVLSKQGLNRIKKRLLKLNLIELIDNGTPEHIKELTIHQSNKGLKCTWCGNTCSVLHKHHYPIPASKGGKTTVEICPNCHYTYHKLMEEINAIHNIGI